VSLVGVTAIGDNAVMLVAALLSTLALATSQPPHIVPLGDTDGTPGVAATFEVEAPHDVVVDLLWDVSRFRRIFPDIKSLAVVRDAHPVVDVRFDVDAVIASPTYTLRRTLDVGAGEIRWVSIAGDVKRIAGRWIVRPIDERRSMVTYESFVDVGVPGLSSVYRDLVKAKLDQMADRVRRGASDALVTKAMPAPGVEPGLPVRGEGF
jgi:ribosome-associated toxin RatA of RatAB toxin-antitoxin module